MKTIAGVFLLLMLAHAPRCAAQFFSSDDKVKDEIFLHEVKNIDEFIERFNDEKSSFIRKEYKEANKPYNFSRKEIIMCLFNLDNANWSKNTAVEEFFRDISDSLHPPHISLTDTNWYAAANCTFLYNKKKIEIPLVLQIQITKNNGAKWMIAGIGDNAVLSTASSSLASEDVPGARTSPKFIAPSSYATSFVELHNSFSDRKNLPDYFEPNLLATDKAKQFINLLLQRKIDFQYASEIKYHFYQLPNWIFIVEQLDRTSLNSGWLINDVKKVPGQEKETSRRQLLQR